MKKTIWLNLVFLKALSYLFIKTGKPTYLCTPTPTQTHNLPQTIWAVAHNWKTSRVIQRSMNPPGCLMHLLTTEFMWWLTIYLQVSCTYVWIPWNFPDLYSISLFGFAWLESHNFFPKYLNKTWRNIKKSNKIFVTRKKKLVKFHVKRNGMNLFPWKHQLVDGKKVKK